MPAKPEFGPHQLLSGGTRVLTRVPVGAAGAGTSYPAGAVGVVVKSPTDQLHSNRVRLVSGVESPLRRAEFAVPREVQMAGLEAPVDVRRIADSLASQQQKPGADGSGGERPVAAGRRGGGRGGRGVALPAADQREG